MEDQTEVTRRKKVKKLSIIIPVYKVEKYIRKCLDSVVNQTEKDIEIIIIDDGSPDGCGAICDDYAKNDERIQVIHKQNRGLCAARNDGIKISTGKWITFVDSDDWCDLDYYERIFKALGDRKVDIFYAGGYYKEYSDKTVMDKNNCQEFIFSDRQDILMLQAKVLSPNSHICKQGKVYSYNGSPWNKIYNTEFIKKSGILYDEASRAWEDLLFNFHVLEKASTVAGAWCPGYHYRMIQTSITHNYNADRIEINRHFLEETDRLIRQDIEHEKALRVPFYARSINLFGNLLTLYILNEKNMVSVKEKQQLINQIKKEQLYHSAITCKSNPYLTTKQRILKFAIKINNIWLLSLLVKYHHG